MGRRSFVVLIGRYVKCLMLSCNYSYYVYCPYYVYYPTMYTLHPLDILFQLYYLYGTHTTPIILYSRALVYRGVAFVGGFSYADVLDSGLL